ncbi:DUF4870 domain-containing protein [Formosa maritima]|uniref:YtxH domain-containing protein n=1 Tax=Formosa maritima TaxID=2592046 RepID=A0A5D0G241_9FLAO|nr:hypothetical protein [Formosa maritima]TYA52389.1 hypothetical protein FVF61_13700 [Formosa maritima]
MSEENKNFEKGTQEKTRDFHDDGFKDGKTIAIIAHMTIIGWIIAFIMNNNNKSEFGSYYIRQVLGIMLCFVILSFVPIIGWFVNVGILILWIISLVGSLSGEMKPIPFLGSQFQDWFKSL